MRPTSRCLLVLFIAASACKSNSRTADGGADLPADSFSCVGAWVMLSDQQSCVKATCVPECDPGRTPMTTITSAPGGPLLTEVRVSSGYCVSSLCYPSAPSGCSQIEVWTLMGVGTTCDLVAVATDGRSQSFRITVVQLGPAVSECCGMPPFPYGGTWYTSTPMGFDPPEVVVHFDHDGGAPDGAGTSDSGTSDSGTPDTD